MADVTKDELRARVLASRRARLAARRQQGGVDDGAAALRALDAAPGARRIASYVSWPTEPSTAALHERCAELGIEVLLPRVLPDGSMELAAGPVEPGLPGTAAPIGVSVAWDSVDLVVVPALAVDIRGVRLGRGRGHYDRALPQTRPGVPRIAVLLEDAELVDEAPREPHDVLMMAVALPSGLFWLE